MRRIFSLYANPLTAIGTYSLQRRELRLETFLLDTFEKLNAKLRWHGKEVSVSYERTPES